MADPGSPLTPELGTCERNDGHFPHVRFVGCNNWQPLASKSQNPEEPR